MLQTVRALGLVGLAIAAVIFLLEKNFREKLSPIATAMVVIGAVVAVIALVQLPSILDMAKNTNPGAGTGGGSF